MEEDDKPGFFRNCWKGIITVTVPIIFSPFFFCFRGKDEYYILYILLVLITFWTTECINIYVTSLVPIFAFAFMGVMESDDICESYLDSYFISYFWGIMMSIALENCGLHYRLALQIIIMVGCNPRKLHIFIVLMTAFISLWLFRPYATALMFPVVKALLEELERNNVLNIYMPGEVEPELDDKKHPSRIALAFLFGIAYAATIGSCGVINELTANTVQDYAKYFPNATDPIENMKFMMWSMPMVIIDIILLLLCLQVTHLGLFRPDCETAKEVAKAADETDRVREIVMNKYVDLGPMTLHQQQVSFWVVCYMGLPILNLHVYQPLTFLAMFIFPMSFFYWSHLKKEGPYPTSREESLLSWEFVQKHFPWGILFLWGSSSVFFYAIEFYPLKKLFIKQLRQIYVHFTKIQLQCFVVLAATLASNVIHVLMICQVLMEPLPEVIGSTDIMPTMICLPIAVASQMAFLLPVGQHTNGIVASQAGIRTKYMIQAGLLPTIFTMVLLIANAYSMQAIVYPVGDTELG